MSLSSKFDDYCRTRDKMNSVADELTQLAFEICYKINLAKQPKDSQQQLKQQQQKQQQQPIPLQGQFHGPSYSINMGNVFQPYVPVNIENDYNNFINTETNQSNFGIGNAQNILAFGKIAIDGNHNVAVNDDNHKKVRSFNSIIDAEQRESPRMIQLRKENRKLKEQLEDCQFALEVIMAKYRQRMLQLLDSSKKVQKKILSEHLNPKRLAKQAEIIQLTDQMQKTIEFYETKISPIYEEKRLEQIEELARLKVEHDGLVEMLNISKRFGSLYANREATNKPDSVPEPCKVEPEEGSPDEAKQDITIESINDNHDDIKPVQEELI